MNASNHTFSTAQQTRRRAMIVPREHGAWGLLFVPLFTGFVAGAAPDYRIGSMLLFTLCAVSLFFLRTPLESLLGIGSIVARTPDERRTALAASAAFALVASVSLIVLIGKERCSALLLVGAVVACTFVAQAVLRKMRSTRMISQMVGALGLTCTAPAAYYIGTRHLERHALILWAVNWIFAGNQIHFVQLRIHAARADTFPEKFGRGKFFFMAQAALLPALAFAALSHTVAPWVIMAFVPAVFRGSLWFFRRTGPLDVKRLGWSEMKHGIAFAILLAAAFLYP